MTPRNRSKEPDSPQGLRRWFAGAHALRIGIALLALGGCARYRYVYGPPHLPPAAKTGWPSSVEKLATGEIEASSLGVVVVSADEAGPASPALHVRLVLRNRDAAQPWRLDTRRQLAYVPGAGTSAPSLIHAEAIEIEIARGEAKTVDLYYPVSRRFQSADDLPGFELTWAVTIAGEMANGRASFVRAVVEPQSALALEIPFGLAPAAGAYWWYQPLPPSATFVHPLVLTFARPPRHVVVREADK
jgi:hypothetical protein